MKVKIKEYHDSLKDLSTDKVYEVIAVHSANLVCILNDVGDFFSTTFTTLCAP